MATNRTILAKVTIEGISPLLMNRFPDQDPNEVSKSSMRGDKGTPREQAEPKAYRLPHTRELYIPGPNIYSGIIEAGKYHKQGKRQVTTQKSSMIPAGIMLMETECPLGITDFEVDSRPVVIPATGGRIMCHRPRLDVWKLDFTLSIETDMFDEKFARLLVNDMGHKIGLGDFRPDRKGPFGRFDVVYWGQVQD